MSIPRARGHLLLLCRRVVVGAPQEVKTANQTGGLYQCDYSTAACEPIQLQGEPSLGRPVLRGTSLRSPGTPFAPFVLGEALWLGPQGSAPASVWWAPLPPRTLRHSLPMTRCPLGLPACVPRSK